nr:hypothetical protein [Tanacetum cinerariifolium]
TSITPLTVAVTPKLTAAVKGKQPAKAIKDKSPSAPSEVARIEAQQLKIILKRSRQQTHISQPAVSSTDEGTGSKLGVSDVPTDKSEEELSWSSSDDEGADDQEKDDAEGSEDDDEVGESDEEVDDEETRVEESFNPILRTSESSEDEGDGEENQGLNVNEEEEDVEEEKEDKLYKDVNINQGREKFFSNDLSLSLKRNTEAKVVVTVDGVIIGAVIGRGDTEVEAVAKIDSMPASLVGFSMTMDTIIEQQVVIDEALVPSTQRCPFYKAFLVTADVPEIYMQEFWATANDPSIPWRNKVNWHYVRDDFMFSTIKLVSRHQNTQQFDALLPIELTNEETRNSKAYKEYYAIATGEAAPKPKASARRTRSGFDTSITPPTATATPRPTAADTLRLTTVAKCKQTTKASKAKSPSALSEVAMTEAEQLKLVLK